MNIIENIRKKNGSVNAVFYGRFSSDMQREESIDAQLRAVKEYTLKNGICLVGEYADRALSGKYDKRPEFQRMITDARSKQFDFVIVHKLDRFARNRADSAIYKKELSKYGVKVISVLENFDDSPEAIILESVIEGYNEYYSRNLAREVMKGLKENALQGKHCGGTPPLGYDVDPVTKRLIINDFEAQAVKLIFRRYIDGAGYISIVKELNLKGVVTKRKRAFSTNSIYEILNNERYTGVYIYNKTAARDENGKRNYHAHKSEDEIIRIDGMIPQIISKDDFQIVREMMNKRRFRSSNRAVETYLLTGKIFCKECGGKLCGTRKVAHEKVYVWYECNMKHRRGSEKCNNKNIRRDDVEKFVLNSILNIALREENVGIITKKYNEFVCINNNDNIQKIKAINQQIKRVDDDLNRISDVISVVNSSTLMDKLIELEQQKQALVNQTKELNENKREDVSEETVRNIFSETLKILREKNTAALRRLIDIFVDKIIVGQDSVEVYFTLDELLGIKKKRIVCGVQSFVYMDWVMNHRHQAKMA